MQKGKALMETLQNKGEAQIETRITSAKESVAVLQDRLCGMSEFSAMSTEQQEQLTKPFNDFFESIERQKLIVIIRDTHRRFKESEYHRLFSKMETRAQSVSPEESNLEGNVYPPHDILVVTVWEPCIEYVSSRSVQVSFEKAWLADETDVARYLESPREALLAEIRQGKRIQV